MGPSKKINKQLLVLSFPVLDYVFSCPEQKRVTSLAASPLFVHGK